MYNFPFPHYMGREDRCKIDVCYLNQYGVCLQTKKKSLIWSMPTVSKGLKKQDIVNIFTKLVRHCKPKYM